MTMRAKKIRAMIVALGWTVGLISLLCAGGAVDGTGTVAEVATLGLIGLICIGAAIVAQRIGD